MIGRDIKLTLEGNSVIENGDFALDEDLDAAFTNRILRASKGAWEYDPNIGVGLQDFAGMPNNAETARQLETDIVSGLRDVGVVSQATVYPIAADAVAIRISVFTTEGQRVLTFSFRYEDAKVTYIESIVNDTEFETRESVNKYDRRIKGENL